MNHQEGNLVRIRRHLFFYNTISVLVALVAMLAVNGAATHAIGRHYQRQAAHLGQSGQPGLFRRRTHPDYCSGPKMGSAQKARRYRKAPAFSGGSFYVSGSASIVSRSGPAPAARAASPGHRQSRGCP